MISKNKHKLKHGFHQIEALFPYDHYYCVKCNTNFRVWKGEQEEWKMPQDNEDCIFFKNDSNQIMILHPDKTSELFETSNINNCPISDEEYTVKQILK